MQWLMYFDCFLTPLSQKLFCAVLVIILKYQLTVYLHYGVIQEKRKWKLYPVLFH